MSVPLIIGGGPAGAAAAIHLARSGTRAILLERTEGPTDKVCGDFLSVEAISELALLGVDVDTLRAPTITRLRMFHGKRVAEADLPFAARGLSRRLLDEALLAAAADQGACVRRGALVQAIDQRDDELVWRSEGREASAGTVFLATGKHDLRGAPRESGRAGKIGFSTRAGALGFSTRAGAIGFNARAGVTGFSTRAGVTGLNSRAGAIGLKTYLRLAPAQTADLAGGIELILFRGGYAGLQLVEDGNAVLCAMVEKARFAACGGTWPQLLDQLSAECGHLGVRLRGAEPLRVRPAAIAGIPYGFVHRPACSPAASALGERVFRLGDQASVIPSLTGDGIALALASARAATASWHAGEGASAYHARFASAIGRQMGLATLLHRLLLGPGAAWATAVGAVAPSLLRQAAAHTRVRPA